MVYGPPASHLSPAKTPQTPASQGTCQRPKEWLPRLATRARDEWKNLLCWPFHGTFYRTCRTSRFTAFYPCTYILLALRTKPKLKKCRQHPASPASKTERPFERHGWEKSRLGVMLKGVSWWCHGKRWDVLGSSELRCHA